MDSPQFKIGDIAIAVSQGVEQTPSLKVIDIQYRGDDIYYKLDESSGTYWPDLVPGDSATWALIHLRFGFSVIPIELGGKRPPPAGGVTPDGHKIRYGWKKYQTEHALETTLQSWEARWPGMNHAIATGAISGVVVLDIDSPEGAQYAKDHGLPETPTATSGNGKHYYFRLPDMELRNRASPTPGLDLRAEGGYVVAPGSFHSERQVTYRWTVPPWECEFADMPDWLLELTKEPEHPPVPQGGHSNGAYAEAALDNELGRLVRTAPGQRNDQLNRAAFALGQLVAAGALNEGDVRRALFTGAQAIGLSESESEATITSGLVSGSAEPRQLPEQAPELPPLPDDDALELELQKLFDAPQGQKHKQLDKVITFLSQTDPFTSEMHINRIAKEKISTKGVMRQAVKARAKAAKATKQEQRPNPTHDELGNRWVNIYGGLTIFVRAKWYRYESGIWIPTDVIAKEVWDILVRAKFEGVRPTKSVKVSVIDYLESNKKIPDQILDANPHLVCLQNGVFNLNGMELMDYSPDFYLTSKLSFEHDPEADCPLWEETVLDWMSGNVIAVQHLQEAVGYSTTSDTKYQLAWMLAGEGANGKDTFLEIMRQLVGSASQELDLSSLGVDNTYGLANLPGKKLVTCSEAVSERDIAASYLKKVISGEPMEARAPYGQPFNFRPICKLWWSVNDKPLVADQTRGFWRRWCVVPFLQTYEGREDFELESKLQAELPGIFNWAMNGLKRLEKNGQFTPVDDFDEATEGYRKMTNVTALFVAETCNVNLLLETPVKVLYAAYKKYCSNNGYRYKGKRRFGDDMVRLGYQRGRMGDAHGTRVHKGLEPLDELQWD